MCLRLPYSERYSPIKILIKIINQVLNFMIGLAQNPTFLFPIAIWMLASWRVARLRGWTPENSQDRVTESVQETVQEQICVRFLEPFFQANNIPLPPGKTVYEVVERMVENQQMGLTNLEYLSQMYSSLESLGMNSPFYFQAVQTAINFF